MLLLRLALMLVFVAHGAHTLFGVFGGPGVGPGGLDNMAAELAGHGLGPSFLLAVMAGLIQFGGGLLLGVGYFARLAAWLLAGYVLAGAWSMHVEWGFFLNWTGEGSRGHGLEYSLVLLGGLACVGLCGPGGWSVDGWRMASAESQAAARARVMQKF
jgi:putative oxidoreductase